MKKILAIVFSLVLTIGLVASAGAGTLDPGWSPQSGSRMHTLNDLYYYLIDGTDPVITDTFQGPAAGPLSGGATWSVESIYDGVKAVFDRSDATPDDVADGKIFFSTETGSWGIQTGTAAGGGGGGLLVTGQTVSYQTGDDGYYELGTAYDYTDNGDGTITDNVTGLMWAKDGNGEGCNSGNIIDWSSAINWAEGLTFAGYSDWRVPNIRELCSIIVLDATMSGPLINHTMFPNTKIQYYWSSTTRAVNTSAAFCIYFDYGELAARTKTVSTISYVRAVRGGE